MDEGHVMAAVGPLLCATFLIVPSALASADVSYYPLPFLSVEGTHYDIGHQIGSNFADQIHIAMQNNTFFNTRMLPYNRTKEGSALYTSYYSVVLRTFPEFLEEIRGMADGANITFSELFLWNMVFEWQSLLDPRNLPPPSCSDLYLVDEDNVLMGHNEDDGRVDIYTTYLVHARVTVPDSEAVEEFTALCMPGELCGNCVGFNLHTGVLSTVNAVFPKNINTSAVPLNYLNRVSLSADYQELLQTLHRIPCSSGFSLNIGDLNSLSVTNVEVWSSGVVETPISGYNYHFNMYLHSDPPQYVDPSSEHRLARVKELPQPNDAVDLLVILGDTHDPQYPIYRDGAPPDMATTIATALFDMRGKMFYLYRDNPASVEPSVVIPLQ